MAADHEPACAGCGRRIGTFEQRVEVKERHAHNLGSHAENVVTWAAVFCSRRCMAAAVVDAAGADDDLTRGEVTALRSVRSGADPVHHGDAIACRDRGFLVQVGSRFVMAELGDEALTRYEAAAAGGAG